MNQPQHPVHHPPMAAYLDHYRGPGISPNGDYLVLPRQLVEQLPYPLQQQLAYTLQQAHQIMAQSQWPVYRVTPSQWVPINELDDRGLHEAGLIAEVDPSGELVYRELGTGRQLTSEETSIPVLVAGNPAIPPS